MIHIVLAAMAAAGPIAPMTEIAPGVHVLRGTFVAGRQPDGNSVLFAAPAGLVVVDTGRHAAHTQGLIDFAAATGVSIRAVVNTHWHLDHLGGNPRLRRDFPGLRVHASTALQDALHGFLATYRTDLEAALETAAPEAAPALRAELAILDAGPALAPDEPVTEPGPRMLAGRRFVLGLETHAVTAGDVWVFDPATRVLAAGDLVTLPAPFLDTACPAGWKASLDSLSKVDFAILVPGHGAPMRRPQFEAYRRGFDRLLACAAADSTAEACIEGWLQDVGPLVPEPEHELTRSLLHYYIGNVLRGDPSRILQRCGE